MWEVASGRRRATAKPQGERSCRESRMGESRRDEARRLWQLLGRKATVAGDGGSGESGSYLWFGWVEYRCSAGSRPWTVVSCIHSSLRSWYWPTLGLVPIPTGTGSKDSCLLGHVCTPPMDTWLHGAIKLRAPAKRCTELLAVTVIGSVPSRRRLGSRDSRRDRHLVQGNSGSDLEALDMIGAKCKVILARAYLIRRRARVLVVSTLGCSCSLSLFGYYCDCSRCVAYPQPDPMCN